jgi:TetR/AcrR family transcriptional repressor of nem operon
MLTKAEQTSKFIIERVAPIFNQKGYAATSMADITSATGLTKGALYGNFKNKEAIAIASFNKTINDLLKQVALHQEKSSAPLGKLKLITDFYRNYFEFSTELGGCPILNIGVDSTNQNTKLLEQVQYVIQKTQSHIVKLVEWGIEVGEIKADVDAPAFAKYLYARIQGAIFMCQTMQDKSYLTDAADEIDLVIDSELRK